MNRMVFDLLNEKYQQDRVACLIFLAGLIASTQLYSKNDTQNSINLGQVYLVVQKQRNGFWSTYVTCTELVSIQSGFTPSNIRRE